MRDGLMPRDQNLQSRFWEMRIEDWGHWSNHPPEDKQLEDQFGDGRKMHSVP